MPDVSSFDALADGFQATLIKADTSHVGTSRPGKGRKLWKTPKVHYAIRKRNRLPRHIGTRRDEWLEACKSARQTIDNAKTDACRQILADASNSPDESRICRTNRSLNGSPDANSPNKAMVHVNRLITSNKRKADLFVGHYSSVGKISLKKQKRMENQALRERLRYLRSARAPAPTPTDFSMQELKRATAAMKPRGAPSSRWSNSLISKTTGTKGLELTPPPSYPLLPRRLHPKAWRNAIILSLFKANKSLSELGLFWHISLTSCVSKLIDRIISVRLYDLADSNGWFSSLQAGFRKGRGVKDQRLRLIYRISDGLQRKEKSLLVMLEFSNASSTPSSTSASQAVTFCDCRVSSKTNNPESL